GGGGEYLAHFVEIMDLDCAMRAQHLGKHAAFAGQSSRVAGDRTLRSLGTADLQHYNRFAGLGGTVQRSKKALRLPHRFEKCGDDLRVRIVNEKFEIVDASNNGLVAR